MFCSKCGATVVETAAFCGACGQPVVSSVGVAAPGGYAAAVPAVPMVGGGPVHYAGFWLRFVAYIIDQFILGIPLIIVIGIVVAVTGMGAALGNIRPGETPDEIFALLGVGFIFTAVVIGLVGSWLYYAMMESSSRQATLGKLALGLYVTDMDGQRLTFGRASGRYFAKLITSLIPLAIGWIIAGFTAKKQALHDMIAGCLVLRKE